MDPTIYLLFVIFILMGGFSLVAAAFNFDWYFESEGVMMITRRFGRKGARIFYAVLGIALILGGIIGVLCL
jgi:hypothetical protein